MAENTVRQIRWFWGWWQAIPLPATPDSSCLIYVEPTNQYYKVDSDSRNFFYPVVRQRYSSSEFEIEEIE